MSDCFDHYADAYDSLLDGRDDFDDSSFFSRGEYGPHKPKCRLCGVTCSWRLTLYDDSLGQWHKCNQPPIKTLLASQKIKKERSMYKILKVTITKEEVIEAINDRFALEFPEQDTKMEWSSKGDKCTLTFEETD
jgi:hypothetical protein